MSTSVPGHPGTIREARRSAPARTSGIALPASIVATLGIAALWVALVLGLQQAAQQGFGMVPGDAWAFAIGILSYIYLFVGFVLGLVYMVTHES